MGLKPADIELTTSTSSTPQREPQKTKNLNEQQQDFAGFCDRLAQCVAPGVDFLTQQQQLNALKQEMSARNPKLQNFLNRRPS